MFIVDSQVHIWLEDHPEAIPRHGFRPLRAADLLAEMRAAHVDRAVIVPPYWMGNDNRYALEASRAHPDKWVVMGRFDLAQQADAALVANWCSQPGMKGVRLLLNQPGHMPYLCGDQGDWFWQAASDCGLPVMLHAPGQIPAIARLAERFPQLRLAIDHVGVGRAVTDADAFTHLDDLLAMARFANVNIKLSTVPIFSSEPYPYRNIHPYLERLTRAFGPRRLFWGSDLSRLPCSYSLCVNLFLEELPWLDAHDLSWIMGRALCEWLDWPIDRVD